MSIDPTSRGPFAMLRQEHQGLRLVNGSWVVEEDSDDEIESEVLEGERTRLLPDGTKEVGTFVAGKLHGPGKKFDSKGHLVEEGMYKEGVLQTAS